MTIHENVKPSAEKQGYVVRQLLRRAVLDAYQMGQRDPFLHRIVPTVVEVMKRPYPELLDSVPRIQTVIREEEEQFLRNLENGLKLLDKVFRKTKASGSNVISGEDAFRLHATSGLYIEITEDLAADQNLRVDRKPKLRQEFMEASTRRSREGRPRPPPSSPPARSTPSRSRITTATSSSATPRPRPTQRSSASSSRTDWPTRPRSGRMGPRPSSWSSTKTPFYGEQVAARWATPA